MILFYIGFLFWVALIMTRIIMNAFGEIAPPKEFQFKNYDSEEDRLWWKYAKRAFLLFWFWPLQRFPDQINQKMRLIFKKEKKC